MDVELITLVNSFKSTIALNNLLIKEKIIRKLDMINTMRMHGFPIMNYPVSTSVKIIDELRRIDKEGDIFKYSNATNGTNKLLGDILHNAFQVSGYDIILSNVPIYGTTVEGEYILLDCEAIYDTLIRYAPIDSVKSVCQIAIDKYLIKMASKDFANELCNLLNGKLLERQIIKMEYIKPLHGMDYFNNVNDIKGISETYLDKNDNKLNSPNENIVKQKQSYFVWFINIIYGFLQQFNTIIPIRLNTISKAPGSVNNITDLHP